MTKKCYITTVTVEGELGELGPRITQCGLGQDLLPYQVASSSIQLFNHNRHDRKLVGSAPFLGMGARSPVHVTQCCLDRGHLPTKWHLDPCSHLVTTVVRPKLWAVSVFWEGQLVPPLAQYGLRRDLPPCQLACLSIQPFGHATIYMGRKYEALSLFCEGELHPHLTQCCMDRRLRPYQVVR